MKKKKLKKRILKILDRKLGWVGIGPWLPRLQAVQAANQLRDIRNLL